MGKIAIINASRDMAGIFGELLARVGGSFTAVKLEPPTEEEKAKRLARVKVKEEMQSTMSDPRKFHYLDDRKNLRRLNLKRDPSMSARQWKKRNKAAKRQGKELTNQAQ